MNEFSATSSTDLALIMVGQIDAMGTHISIYLTVVSAYLAISYVVGKKLTNLQISIATAIYITAYVFESIVIFAIFNSAIFALEKYQELNPSASASVIQSTGAIYLGCLILAAILVSSIWFMLSVRYSEKE